MKVTQADVLIGLAQDTKLFYAPGDDAGYVTFKVSEHEETWALRSKAFKRWLVSAFVAAEGKPPGAQAVADAIGALEAAAQFQGYPRCEVFVRVAGDGDTIYIDLGNEAWEVVKVTSTGWEVISNPAVKFRRPRGLRPLPRPVPGSLLELRRFVNAPDQESWTLMLAWLIAAVRPTGPYPLLSLLGEQGSAKTTTAEVFKRLLDPGKAPVRSEPRDVRDLMIAATNGWVIAFDNVSHIPDWLSDALCRMSTGGGFSTRELYTDGDEIIFDTERPVIVTGIEEVVGRGDLLDRALLVVLPPIPDSRRRPEADFWAEFDAARPALLGGLLDAVAAAIRGAPGVRLAELPRMADFAIWTTAAAPALGWSANHFLATYAGNRAAAHEVALESFSVAPLVRELAEAGPWEGTAAELLERLSTMATEQAKRQKTWPATARTLAGALRRAAPSLRRVGVNVEFSRAPGGARRRVIAIQKMEAPDSPDRPARPESAIGAESEGSGRDDRDAAGTVAGTHRPAETPRQMSIRDDGDGRDDESPTQSDRHLVPVPESGSDEEEL